MLKLSAGLLNKPVLSLRSGGPVATVLSPIINPANLKIEGFYCQDTVEKRQLVLLERDIREILPQGLAINDYDVLAEPDDLIRLKKVLEQDFDIMGKQVVTTSKDKVGKVADYAIESETMYIQKIYVSQSLFKSLTGGTLSVDRSQVVDVDAKRITINDLLKTAPATATAGIS
jgi:sporulation protein YlmC with PRC-barrel domain